MLNLMRCAVVVSSLLVLIFYALPFFDLSDSRIYAEVQMKYDGFGALWVPTLTVYFGIPAVGLVVAVLLLTCAPYADRYFIAMQLVLMASIFFWGLRVSTPIESFLAHLITLLDGAVIGMLIANSQLRDMFRPAQES